MFGLCRIVLVITGLMKGPVLNMFERYGDDDPLFFPWPQLMAWLGALVIAASYLLNRLFGSRVQGNLFALCLLLLAYIIYQQRYDIQKLADRLNMPVVPLWYARLRENTTRSERRRIAYMWLRLPIRTRLLMNASDQYFFQWADLVIMSSVHEV
ncbi:MAG: hypothetical protein OHK0046_05650 [Anaerolineae bacterium]